MSIAGLIATRPGNPQARLRLIYRLRTHRGRKGERRGFSEADYAALFDAAHQQLGGPIVVVWDNLNTHASAEMRRLIAARPWLTVFYLPAYAPELISDFRLFETNQTCFSICAPARTGLDRSAEHATVGV